MKKKDKAQQQQPKRAGPSQRPARARGVKPAGGPGLPARERARGDASMTHGRRQPESGDAPASDFARHSTPPSDSSHTHALLDEGNLKLAAPQPEGHRNSAGDELRGGREQPRREEGFRKREREGRARRGAETHPRRVGLDGEAGEEVWQRESLGGAHRRRRRERDGRVDSGSFTAIPCAGVLNSTTRRQCCR